MFDNSYMIIDSNSNKHYNKKKKNKNKKREFLVALNTTKLMTLQLKTAAKNTVTAAKSFTCG